MPSTIEQLADLLKDFQFCTLTTSDYYGQLHSRPMTLQEARPGCPLWFVSKSDASMVSNLANNNLCNLAFHRRHDHAWVSVAGRARINPDQDLIQKLWSDEWQIWFENGRKTEGMVLVEIEPVHINFWEPEKGKLQMMADMLKAHFFDSDFTLAPTQTCRPDEAELAGAIRR